MYSRTVLIGTLVGDAITDPEGEEDGIRFAVEVDDQTVQCQARGDYPSKMAPLLRRARLVQVAGALRLRGPAEPFIAVQAVRFLASPGPDAKVAGWAPLPTGAVV